MKGEKEEEDRRPRCKEWEGGHEWQRNGKPDKYDKLKNQIKREKRTRGHEVHAEEEASGPGMKE